MKKLLLSTVALSTLLFSKTMYLQNDETIFSDNKPVGFATILTPVEVLSQDKNSSKVEIIGYANEYYQVKLIKDPMLAEDFIVFEDENATASYEGDENPYIKVLEKIEDNYGETWLKAKFSLEVKNSSLIDDPNTLYSEAKNLYEQSCSSCHRLHDTKEFTISQWPLNVEEMISSGFVFFEPSQRDLIIKYLQHNAKDAN